MPKLTNKYIESLRPSDREQFFWDIELKRLGIRIYPTGRKSFVLQYRLHGRTRRMGLGVYPLVNAATARRKALKALAAVQEGEDPQFRSSKSAPMLVEELCELYLAEGVDHKKASTIDVDKGRIRSHIVPILGKLPVDSIRKQDVERMQADIAAGKTALDKKNPKRHSRSIVTGGKGGAARTIGLFGGICTFAVERGLIDFNPVRGVRKFPDRRRDRVLSSNEWKAIGRVLKSNELMSNARRQAILFTMMTGCRRGEVESLLWSYVDFDNGFLRLPDSKTGAKVVPLGDIALSLLKELPKDQKPHFVFPGRNGVRMCDLSKSWKKVCKVAGVEDCRLHDLRHQFATIGVTQGTGDRLFVVGQLLGHRDSQTTQRYAHLQQSYLKDAASQIGNKIVELLEENHDTDHI